MSEVSPHKRRRTENGIGNNDLSDTFKIFNDSVHGHIEMNEVCLAIIDTPQFQRLRLIKQLGFCYYVYPGASHNRFEHSLGVCHLAGELVRSLRNRQPELDITPKDILCVEIAGLCHDLGHGPHSHMFDGKFIPLVRGNMDWKHEKATLKMFDFLVDDNGLKDGIFDKYGLGPLDIKFIKELIYGPLKDNGQLWPYEGREEKKSFLYEIVSNKPTGIDVDKWDYFARDCHHLGIVNNFDHKRFIKFARVLKVDGRFRICARDKEIGNLYQMFYTRYNLHRTAYQHKVSFACEIMAVDALVKANNHMLFPGKNVELKISECIDDMTAYIQLTDDIIWQIYISQDPKLEEAKKIVKRIYSRDLYRCLDEKPVSKRLQEQLGGNMVMATMKKLDERLINISETVAEPPLKGTDFRLLIVYMDFGKKDKDPLKAMRYYSKSEPNKPIEGHAAGLLKPPRFNDNLIRVYSRVSSKEDNFKERCQLIKESFAKLCDEWNITEQNTSGWEQPSCSTPEKAPFSLTSEVSAGKGRASMSQDD